MKNNKLIIALLSLTAAVSSGCQKLINIDVPINAITTASVFTDSTNVQSAVAGMYSGMYVNTLSLSSYGIHIDYQTSMMADDMSYNGTLYTQFRNNSLVSSDIYVTPFWADTYTHIYRANAIIEGVAASALSAAVKNQATGEALFIRSLCNFYLVNLFGDVPLITSIDVAKTQLTPRTPVAAVYQQIISDLQKAATLLPDSYAPYGNARVRATKFAALALLARAYLYTGDYANAEATATQVINSTTLYSLQTDLTQVFLANSKEAILQFDGTALGFTLVGATTIPSTAATPATYTLTAGLVNAFEANDKRKTSWTATALGFTYPYKYKVKTKGTGALEFDVILRFAEQYLIRAEARANGNTNIGGAQSDLNVIRTRAGLPGTTATDKASLLLAIEQERRVELFSEWSHRWLDLKRTKRVDAVIGALKPTFWQPTDALYPIPSVERGKNPSLTQNDSYN